MSTNEIINPVSETVESAGNQIIEIIEYISEKMGIAVNWSADNIWPHVEDLLTRITQYKIVSHSIGLAIGFILLFVGFVCINKLSKDHKVYKAQKDNAIYWTTYKDSIDLSGKGLLMLIIVILTLIAGATSVFTNANDFLEWLFIPEIRLIEYVSDLIGKI